jgi:hypothetical protein
MIMPENLSRLVPRHPLLPKGEGQGEVLWLPSFFLKERGWGRGSQRFEWL